MEYEDYLQSPEWKQRAEELKERAGNRCQLCNASDQECVLHVHHRTYERIGNEEPMDLFVLCELCHARTHLQPWKPSRRRLAHVLRLNGIHPLKEQPSETQPWQLYERAKHVVEEELLRAGVLNWQHYEHCILFVVDYLGV